MTNETPTSYIKELEKGCGTEYVYNLIGITNRCGGEINEEIHLCPSCTKAIASAKKMLQLCTKSELEFLEELSNNLQDDLELDLGSGENGYKTYEESYKAIKEYSQKLLNKKIEELKTLGGNVK